MLNDLAAVHAVTSDGRVNHGLHGKQKTLSVILRALSAVFLSLTYQYSDTQDCKYLALWKKVGLLREITNEWTLEY